MESGPILLFDGHCGLCDAAVQWILNRDVSGVFRMAPLHGETAAEILARHPDLPDQLDSLILVEVVNGRGSTPLGIPVGHPSRATLTCTVVCYASLVGFQCGLLTRCTAGWRKPNQVYGSERGLSYAIIG